VTTEDSILLPYWLACNLTQNSLNTGDKNIKKKKKKKAVRRKQQQQQK
jgi:hypothetical protein